MGVFEEVNATLSAQPRRWLVTGCAGFIGSNLVSHLLQINQQVIGLDNFATGKRENIDAIQALDNAAASFDFVEGDITDLSTCEAVTAKVDIVLHQAALGSVPRSIENPHLSNRVNVDGFLNMIDASRRNGVGKFVYAASSSTYGDHPDLPKIEDKIGNPLSPYAVTKLVNELYAQVYKRVYDFDSIGLRYFNVFGRRQDPNGAYAAVIPKWIGSILQDERITINGDGETSRDFCYIDNVIQANILAAMSTDDAWNQVYNVACNDRTSLNQLYEMLISFFAKHDINHNSGVEHADFRRGDVRHSMADISKAHSNLGYEISHSVSDGLAETVDWYIKNQAG